MRVWDVHPGYLSNRSLLGEHAEMHAIFSIISGDKKGYAAHPETMRWQGHLDKLVLRHDITVKEMLLRGFTHRSSCGNVGAQKTRKENVDYILPPVEQFALLESKYRAKGEKGRIPLPGKYFEFWSHYKYSIKARNKRLYTELEETAIKKEESTIAKESELVERVLAQMLRPAESACMKAVIADLQQEFSKDILTEQEEWRELPQQGLANQLDCLFKKAQKYRQTSLLQSTLFADIFI